MKVKTSLSILALVLLTASSVAVPAMAGEAQASVATTSFDHPEGLPDQASDNAREALEARGTHDGDGRDGDGGNGGDNENAAIVVNEHRVTPGGSVTIEHIVTNEVVDLNITITVTPGQGVDKTMTLEVNPPGEGTPEPGPPGDVPRRLPEDVPRGRGDGE